MYDKLCLTVLYVIANSAAVNLVSSLKGEDKPDVEAKVLGKKRLDFLISVFALCFFAGQVLFNLKTRKRNISFMQNSYLNI